MKNILYLSSEIEGIVNTGGLSGVAYEYSIALKKRGYNIVLAMPKYGFIGDYTAGGEKISYMFSFKLINVNIDGDNYSTEESCDVYITHVCSCEKDIKVPVYLLGNSKFFRERTEQNMYLYSNIIGNDIVNKFVFFCRGVLEMLPILETEGIEIKPDVIHCNDWQTAATCMLLKDVYSKISYYKNISLLFTVHNSLYHGYANSGFVFLVSECYKNFFITKNIEFKDCIMLITMGLMYSDFVTTVSPKNAEEICAFVRFTGSRKLASIFKKLKKEGRFKGILNGLGYEKSNITLGDSYTQDYGKGKNIIEFYKNQISLHSDVSQAWSLDMNSKNHKNLLVEVANDKKYCNAQLGINNSKFSNFYDKFVFFDKPAYEKEYIRYINELKENIRQTKKYLKNFTKKTNYKRFVRDRIRELNLELKYEKKNRNTLALADFNPLPYSDNTLNIKYKNKKNLQNILDFPVSNEIPIILISGRLCYQKGIHVLYRCIPQLIMKYKDIQIIIKGIASSNEKELFEIPALMLEKKFKKNVRAILNFSKDEVLKLYSSTDIILMPSEYEPCGLVQMEGGMRGCIPVCSMTGGLDDTVQNYEEYLENSNENRLIGFKFLFDISKTKQINNFSKFKTNPKAKKQLLEAEKNLICAIGKAVDIYKNNKRQWDKVVSINMNIDFSWAKGIEEYTAIYENIHAKKLLQTSNNATKESIHLEDNRTLKIFYSNLEIEQNRYEDYYSWGIILYNRAIDGAYKIFYFDKIQQIINDIEYMVLEVKFKDIEEITNYYQNALYIGIHKNGFNPPEEPQRCIDFNEYPCLHDKSIFIIAKDYDFYFEPLIKAKCFDNFVYNNLKINDSEEYEYYNYVKNHVIKDDKKLIYIKEDMGLSTIYDKKTNVKTAIFKLWAPMSKNVELLIYSNQSDKVPEKVYNMYKQKTIWEFALTLSEVIDKFYTFKIDNQREFIDPCAKACSYNATRAAIIDFEKTNPPGWINHEKNFKKVKNFTVYEIHIKDFTRHPCSQIDKKFQGKFKGIISKIEYLREIAVDCIQLLPVIKFDTNEGAEDEYQWGYNQIGCWFLLEGQYCTDPKDPYNRIFEFKEMIKACHEKGIRVIMDVVYNHVSGKGERLFQEIFPNYYFRQKKDSTLSTGLYGNEIATEHTMVKTLILNSLKYFMQEYCIDGFRFDVMSSIDVGTLKEIEQQLRKINEDVIIYGEGNPIKTSVLEEPLQSCWYNMYKFKHIGVLSNTSSSWPLRGYKEAPGLCYNPYMNTNLEIFDKGSQGYLLTFNDSYVYMNNRFTAIFAFINKYYKSLRLLIIPIIIRNILRKFEIRKSANRLVHFIDTHDDLLLFDYLSMQKISRDEVIKRYKLAYEMLFGYQGSILLKSGVEILTSKSGNYNTHTQEKVNLFEWNNVDKNLEIRQIFINLINFRKNHAQMFDGSGKIVTIHFKNKNLVMKHIKGKMIKSKDNLKRIIIIHNLLNKDEVVFLPKYASKYEWSVVYDGHIMEFKDLIDNAKPLKVSALSTLILVMNSR